MNITKTDLVNMGCDAEHAEDWLSVRKAKKKPLTGTALKRMQTEASKAGLSLAQAVLKCAEESWVGFKAEYVTNKKQNVMNHLSVGNINDTSW